MKTLMFKEKKKHEIKNWFDNFIDAYTHPKKKKKNPKQKQTLLPMKVLNSIKLKYFCTSL